MSIVRRLKEWTLAKEAAEDASYEMEMLESLTSGKDMKQKKKKKEDRNRKRIESSSSKIRRSKKKEPDEEEEEK